MLIFSCFIQLIVRALMIFTVMLSTDKCIEALVVRGAILMSRFLQGEESDSFSWLNPSGFIDSVREKRGLRDSTAAQEEQDA